MGVAYLLGKTGDFLVSDTKYMSGNLKYMSDNNWK